MQTSEATIRSTDSSNGTNVVPDNTNSNCKVKAYVSFACFEKNYEKYLRVKAANDEAKHDK